MKRNAKCEVVHGWVCVRRGGTASHSRRTVSRGGRTGSTRRKLSWAVEFPVLTTSIVYPARTRGGSSITRHPRLGASHHASHSKAREELPWLSLIGPLKPQSWKRARSRGHVAHRAGTRSEKPSFVSVHPRAGGGLLSRAGREGPGRLPWSLGVGGWRWRLGLECECEMECEGDGWQALEVGPQWNRA